MEKTAEMTVTLPEPAAPLASPQLAPETFPGVVVIGVGNDFRTDDALGLLVARELRRAFPSATNIVEASGEGAALIEIWKGARAVIIVDAVHSGAAPGTLHHVDLSEQDLPVGLLPRSSHAFGVAESVSIARALGQIPPRVVLLGIEGVSYEHGTTLSQPVLRSLPALLLEITHELDALQDP